MCKVPKPISTQAESDVSAGCSAGGWAVGDDASVVGLFVIGAWS